KQLLPKERPPGDAVVALVLRRLEDARKLGENVLATVELGGSESAGETPATTRPSLELASDNPGLSKLFGHAHAASGLLHVAAAALACSKRALPAPEDGPEPWTSAGERALAVEVAGLGGGRSRVVVKEDAASASGLLLEPAPRVHVYSGAD